MLFVIRLLKVMLALVIVALGFWFTSENSGAVSLVVFGFVLPELKVGLWVLGAFLLGAALGVFTGIGPRMNASRQLKKQRNALKKQEAELHRLRVAERVD